MLKMLEAIFHGKIATENIDTTGHKRLRVSCSATAAVTAAVPVPLPARSAL